MLNFYLTHHFEKKFVVDLLINWLNDIYRSRVAGSVSTKWRSTGCLAMFTTRVVRRSCNFDLLTYLTVKTFFIGHSMSIFESLFKFTQKTNNFVATIAFFSVHWHLFTNHTAALIYKVSLEIVLHCVRINLHEAFDRWEPALAENTVDLMV